jgi:periplasmic divalent cation tolerance protein
MTEKVFFAFSSCPEATTAKRIAEALVTERLAACVNRIDAVASTYVWDGRLQDESEVLLIMKTVESRLAALTARVIELHPYELPEVVAVEVSGGNEQYLQWVRMGVMNKDRA